MRLGFVTAFVAAMALAACERAPMAPDGSSLLCNVDADCRPTAGERCFENLCVLDQPPTVAPISPVRVEVGHQNAAVTPSATDPEGDHITLTWSQVNGPATIALADGATEKGASFSHVIPVFGDYVFQVKATDEYSATSGSNAPVAVQFGLSAYCTLDNQCPSPKRCADEDCVTNVEPSLDDLAAVVPSTVDTTYSVTATATDPEDDALQFSWVQISGPEVLLAQPVASATLSVTPHALGFYVFEVSVTDGYPPADSVPGRTTARLTLVSQPAGGAVYVSDTAPAAPADLTGYSCGSFDAPCPNVTVALEQVRAATVGASTGAKEIFLAAATLGAYPDCLDLGVGPGADTDEKIAGCYDPYTWVKDTSRRDQCRLECSAATGHELSDATEVHDLTLAMDHALGAPAGGAPLATVRAYAGNPLLSDVDVEVAPCGQGCTGVGVLAIGSDVVLERVDVVGGSAGFAPLDQFIGVYTLGGSPELRGATNPRAPGSTERGRIVLNAPANLAAFGLLTLNSQVVVQGLGIEGGLGQSLMGGQFFGGTAVVDGSTVALTGFGTRILGGFSAGVCTAASCACPAGVSCPGGFDATDLPSMQVTASNVDLLSGSSTDGLVPCLATGVSVSGSHAGHLVKDSTIHIGDHVSLGIAVSADGRAGTGSGDATSVLDNPELSVGSATVDALCSHVIQGWGWSGNGQAIGVLTSAEQDAVVHANVIRVGANESGSIGIVLSGSGTFQATNNDVLVATSAAPIAVATQAIAIAATATVGSAASPSLLSANRAYVDAYTSAGYGIYVSNDVHWDLVDNFVFGGFGGSAVGVAVVATATTGTSTVSTVDHSNLDFPRLVFDTVFAGGGPDTVYSAALLLSGSDDRGASPAAVRFGLVENTLLDGGSGQGRRMLIANSPLAYPAVDSAGSVAQFVDSVPGPDPMHVVAVSSVCSLGTCTASNLSLAYLALVRELQQVESVSLPSGGTPTESSALTVQGRPVAAQTLVTKTGFDTAITVPGQIELVQVDSSNAPAVTLIPTDVPLPSGGIGTVQASDALYTTVVSGLTLIPTVVFAVPAATGAPGVYLSQRIAGKYEAARPLKGHSFVDPKIIARGLYSGQLLAVDQACTLHAWPQTMTDPDNPTGPKVGLSFDVCSITQKSLTVVGDTSPVTLGPAPLLAVQAVTIGDKSGVDPPDLLIIDGAGRPFIFLNPVISTPPLPAAEPMKTTVCAPGTATAAVVADLSSATGTNEIWFGCSDGSTEIWLYNTIDHQLDPTKPQYFMLLRRFAAPLNTPAVTGLALQQVTDGTTPQAFENVLFITRAGTNSVEAQFFDGSTITSSSFSFASDIPRILADGTFGTDLSPFTTEVRLLTTAAGPVCKIVTRPVQGAAFDLHLASDDTECVGQGAATTTPPVTTDIDGGTRDAGPDVGADELGSP